MINISESVEKITEELISIHSVIGEEKELCDKIEETLDKTKVTFTRVSNSIVGRLDFGKERTIALVGHIDTVPYTRENHTTPYIIDDELWGLGSSDMKSGVASILKIIDDLENERVTPTKNLVFVFYEAEEGPLPNGVNKLLDANLLDDIDFAYILEPTEGRYSVGCLGAFTVKKRVQGISAHSANPKTGKNAILEATEIFNKVIEADKKLGTSEISGNSYYETMNVTQFNTENAANVIPPFVNMTINYRFSPEKSLDEAEKAIFDVIGNKDGVYFTDRSPSCYIGSGMDEFLIDTVEQEIMQAWTDIAQLNLVGIPSVNYGPGSIKVAHKPDERLSLSDLREYYKMLIKHI